MKKFLLLVAGLILIAFFGFIVWFFFFSSETTEPEQPFGQENSFGTFFDTEFQNRNEYDPNFDNLDTTDFVQKTKIPILRQLSREPVAGYTFFKREFEVPNPDFQILEDSEISNKEDAENPEDIQIPETEAEPIPETIIEEKLVFRFMERITGHIYDTFEHNINTEKITNTTTQKVYNAIFSNDGSKIIFEKLSENDESVNSFFGEIVEPETIENEEGENEPLNQLSSLQIQSYSILSENFIKSPVDDVFAYFVENLNSSSLTTDSFDLNKKSEISSTPLKDIIYSWDSDDYILRTTKASSGELGYSYTIDMETGSTNKILSGVPGLTAKLSPNGQYVLFSESTQNLIILSILNLNTGENKRLSISTLPEKCVFSNTQDFIIYCGFQGAGLNASMPDDWYKGKVSFNDYIWKINFDKNTSEVFYRFDEQKFGQFDIVDIKITEQDEFLTFQNKKDMTLWSLNIKELNNTDFFSPEDSLEEPQEVF